MNVGLMFARCIPWAVWEQNHNQPAFPVHQHSVWDTLRGSLRKPEASVWQSGQDVPSGEETRDEETLTVTPEVSLHTSVTRFKKKKSEKVNIISLSRNQILWKVEKDNNIGLVALTAKDWILSRLWKFYLIAVLMNNFLIIWEREKKRISVPTSDQRTSSDSS